jgi:hypothetical protein
LGVDTTGAGRAGEPLAAELSVFLGDCDGVAAAAELVAEGDLGEGWGVVLGRSGTDTFPSPVIGDAAGIAEAGAEAAFAEGCKPSGGAIAFEDGGSDDF